MSMTTHKKLPYLGRNLNDPPLRLYHIWLRYAFLSPELSERKKTFKDFGGVKTHLNNFVFSKSTEFYASEICKKPVMRSKLVQNDINDLMNENERMI